MGRKKKPPMIPNDVIWEILSWAPASSLLRFRWVCKYWFDLIRDPHFLKMHLLHHSTTTTHQDGDHQTINKTSLLVMSRTHPQVIYSMRCIDVFNQSMEKLKMGFYNLVPISDGYYDKPHHKFWGSCNGLLYTSLSFDSSWYNPPYVYYLWNPCTRDLKKLPRIDENIIYSSSTCPDFNVHGFGYDHTIDDYKVLRMEYYHSLFRFNNLFNSRVTNVYTLGTNSWSKKFESIPLIAKDEDIVYSKNIDRSFGLLFNGALHWIMRSPKQHGYLVKIMYFDIAKDEHGEMELPTNYYADIAASRQTQGTLPELSLTTSDLDLIVLNGCLCISQFHGYEKMDVWMMKDYIVKDSWTKFFTINMKQLLDEISFKLYDLKLLKYHKDGEILMVFNGKYYVSMYDPVKKTKKNLVRYVHKIGDDDHQFENLFVEATYIETFVSLNSGKTLSVAGSRTTTLRKEIEEEKEDQKHKKNNKKKKNYRHLVARYIQFDHMCNLFNKFKI